MKTVMKKMFCLLLVAVLMVGAMPFQAFAAPPSFPSIPGSPGGYEHAHYYVDDGWETTTNPTCTNEGSKTRTCASPNCNDREGSRQTDSIPALTHSFPETWTVSQAPTCDNAGEEVRICTRCNGNETGGRETRAIDALGHTEVIDAAVAPSCDETGLTQGSHCSACPAIITAQTEVAALGHDFENGACSVCGEEEPEEKEPVEEEPAAPVRQDITWQIKNKEGGAVVDSGTFTPNGETAKAKDILYYHVFNKTTAWKDQYSVDKVWSSKQQKDVGYEGSIAEGDTVTYVLTPKENNSGNNGSSSIGDDGLVKVHVTLHTSNTETATVELLRYRDASSRKIYASIAAHEDLIRAELAKKYPGYEWSGNVYDDPSKNQNMTETIGEGTTVYINAYTGQDMVLIYVHKSRTFEPDRIIQLQGKKIGQTVTKSEVTKAVSQYYTVSSLSMYEEDDWEKLVNGKSVESVSSIKISDDDYFIIDVKISGSAKSTSGSGAKADSTNPKTGDEIFAPSMVMGLSASALVVLYFLNKKRAY